MSDREKKMFLNMGEDILTGRKKMPKGRISDREMKIFLDGMSRAGTARNKPKWKDRSAYPGRKK